VDRKKLLRCRFGTLVAPEDRERWQHHFMGMMKQEIGRQKYELGMKRGDGSIFQTQLDCLLMTQNDAPPVMRITLTDITERKQAEAQLRLFTERKQAEAQLRLFNESLEQRVLEELEKNQKKDILLIQQSRLAAIGEVIHNVSHHWRQPLSAVSLILGNIKDAYEFNELNQE